MTSNEGAMPEFSGSDEPHILTNESLLIERTQKLVELIDTLSRIK